MCGLADTYDNVVRSSLILAKKKTWSFTKCIVYVKGQEGIRISSL